MTTLFEDRIPNFGEREDMWPSEEALHEHFGWDTEHKGSFPSRLTWNTDPSGVRTIDVHSDSFTVNGNGERQVSPQRVISWSGDGSGVKVKVYVGEDFDPGDIGSKPSQISSGDTLAINTEIVHAYTVWSSMLADETAWQPPFVTPPAEAVQHVASSLYV
jgi:hypothetical protein